MTEPEAKRHHHAMPWPKLSSPEQRLIGGVFFALLLVFFTNHWMSWESGHRLLQANDMKSYERIAKSFPHFPEKKMYSHHAQRFAYPYLIGGISHVFGISHRPIFRVVAILAVLGTLFFLAKIYFLFFKTNFSLAWIIFSLFLFNPYSIRYYLIASGILTDLLFVFSLSWCLYALKSKKKFQIPMSLSFGILAKQTVLLVIPGILLWVLFSKDWKKERRKKWVLFSLMIPVLALIFCSWISNPMTSQSTLVKHGVEILKWIFSPEFSWSVLLDQTLRPIFPFAPLGAISFVLLRKKWHTLSNEFWIAFGFIFLPVLSQPIVSIPATGQSGSRLGALAMIPALFLMILLIRDTKTKLILNSKNRKTWVLGAMILFLASFHHLYTPFGPTTVSELVLVQTAASFFLGLLTFRLTVAER